MDEAEREVMMIRCRAGGDDGTMPSGGRLLCNVERGKLMIRGRAGGEGHGDRGQARKGD